jgi:TnpA family transposase
MPVSFLTDVQKQRYGRYTGDLTAAQLAQYFHFDEIDRRHIARRRHPYNRLGFAVQLGTVRFLGTFLIDPTQVPRSVVRYLSHQLNIADPSCLTHYRTSEQRWEHAAEIRHVYGYQDFLTSPVQFRLQRWLYALCWTGTDRPSVLFDRATTWLIAHKVLLPGASVLERLVARVRSRVEARVWRILTADLTPDQQSRLSQLLLVCPGSRQSTLDRLRRGPTRRSVPALRQALARLEEVRAIGLLVPGVSRVPPARLQALARFATTARVTAITRLAEPRKQATLAAFIHLLEASAHDDALDLLEGLLSELFAGAVKAGKQARLRTLKDLDAAADRLLQACTALLDPTLPDAAVRATAFSVVPRDDLVHAAQEVDRLIRPPDDVYYQELLASYRRVRQFLPRLLQTITFEASPAGQPVADALGYLKEVEEHGRRQAPEPPLEVVTPRWQRYVVRDDGTIDPRAYTFCVVDRLRATLRRHDLFVHPSVRYEDPRRGLLDGAAWETARPMICRSLSHSANAQEAVDLFRQQLDETYRTVAARFPKNPAVRIETHEGKDRLVLSPLEKLEEPPSLVALRKAVAARLPRVDLPDILLEVAERTGFATAFTHVSEDHAQVDGLALSLCAVLLAEACNIGIEPLVRSDVPALHRARLAWVNQNYLRHETLTEGNALLVARQNAIPLVHSWGGGEVASADGMRFVVPVRTVHAGPNPKYFGRQQGATYYNLVSDQGTGLNAITVPGTLRDSLILLSVLLEQQTDLQPTEIMTDTGAYTDVIFGLFRLLGYRFTPRLADLGDARMWRMDPGADYGVLNGLARHRLRPLRIINHWDDMLRLAGSLRLGAVQATAIMRTLQVGDQPTKLAQAVAELGRLEKTIHILTYIDDESVRRRVLLQLNRHEERHKLARAVFHGKRGELRKRYREGQEDQLGALGLVVNMIVLWNTIYMDAALKQLRAEGYPVRPEDVARLHPLRWGHINMLGRYAFSLPDEVVRGELRPLRNPTDTGEELWDDLP